MEVKFLWAVLLVSIALLHSGIGGVDGRKVTQVGGKCGWSEGCLDYIEWYKTTPLKAGRQVAFRYSAWHNVFQFNNKAAWDACNVSEGVSLSTGPDAGLGNGVIVDVTKEPKYIACTVPANLFPGTPAFHCLNGQKVIIQGGLGRKRYNFQWVLGGLVDYQKEVNKRKAYKIGESFGFHYSCCHSVWALKDEAHYKACNFTGGVELGGEDAKSVIIPITDKPAYIACGVEPHCSLGQKVMLPAGY